MTTLVGELYDALRKIGIEDTVAREAAHAVFELRADLVSKGDLQVAVAELKKDMAEMKADIIKWNVGAMAVLTGIFAAIVRLTP